MGSTLSKNMAVQLTGKIASVLIGLGVVAIMTRSLGTQGYGEYTTAVTFLQLFGVLVDFGLTLTLVVMISEPGVDEEKIAGNILGLRLASGALLYAFAPLAVIPFDYTPATKLAVAIGAGGYFLMAGAAILTGIFQKHAVMWRAALAEILNRVALVTAVGFVAWLHGGVVLMTATLIVSNAVWLLSAIILARPLVRLRPRADFAVWKRTLSRSWPIAISIFFNLIYLKGDILFLAHFRSPEEVGYYGVAYRFIDVLTVLPTMYMGLLLPSLVADHKEKRLSEFQRHLSRTFDLFMMAAIPIVIGTQILAQPLTHLLAGAGFEPAGGILKVLIFAAIGVFIGALYGHTVVAVNKQKPMIWGYAAVAIVTITGYILLIPPFGMYGAAWMTILSECAIALITFLVVRAAGGGLPSLRTAGKALAAGIVMALVLLVFPRLHPIIDLLLGALIYLLALIGLRAVTFAELRALIPHRQSF